MFECDLAENPPRAERPAVQRADGGLAKDITDRNGNLDRRAGDPAAKPDRL